MDSLVLDGLYELIGTTTNPEYGLGDGAEFGQPAPDTAKIVGTLLDGDRITGERSGNRQMVIPITVFGTSKPDLAAKVNRLIQIVNQPTFTLQWTPDQGSLLIYDGYRGLWTRSRDRDWQEVFRETVTLTFEAGPYGRSADPTVVSVAAPTLQLDAYNTAPTGASFDSAQFFDAPSSARATLTRISVVVNGVTWYRYDSPDVTRALTPVSLVAFSSVGVRLRWPAPTSYRYWSTYLDLTLTDGTNSATVTSSVVQSTSSTGWTLVTWPLSGFAGVNLAAVTRYHLFLHTAGKSRYDMASTPPSTSSAWLDDLRAFPSSSSSNTIVEGMVLKVPAWPGTARAPVSIVLDRGGSTFGSALVHSPPGSQDPDCQILSQLVGGTVTIPAVNSRFYGTYDIVLVWTASGSGVRVVDVTVTQLNGATVVDSQVVSTTYDVHGTGPYQTVGQITLPLVEIPRENTSTSYTFTVTSTGTADTFSALALCDVAGQLWKVAAMPATSTKCYLDEPSPGADIGPVFASATDRTMATGVLQFTLPTGGPITLEPGDNRVAVLSQNGALNLSASGFARWLDEIA